MVVLTSWFHPHPSLIVFPSCFCKFISSYNMIIVIRCCGSLLVYDLGVQGKYNEYSMHIRVVIKYCVFSRFNFFEHFFVNWERHRYWWSKILIISICRWQEIFNPSTSRVSLNPFVTKIFSNSKRIFLFQDKSVQGHGVVMMTTPWLHMTTPWLPEWRQMTTLQTGSCNYLKTKKQPWNTFSQGKVHLYALFRHGMKYLWKKT